MDKGYLINGKSWISEEEWCNFKKVLSEFREELTENLMFNETTKLWAKMRRK